MVQVKIKEVLQKVSRPKRIPTSEYLSEGAYPVIDQGQNVIAGYTNDEDAVISSPLPMVIFGDHTRAVKFSKVPFATGADGTQLLYPQEGIDPTYFYYAVKNVDLSNYFYARHFKYLKEKEITIFDLPTQQKIASVLSAYDDLIENNRRCMEILEESARLIYRKMFGDDVPDADRWPVVKIGDILCKVHRAVKIPKEEYCESGTYPCIDQSREFIGGYTNNEAAVNHDLPAIVFGDHTRILKFVRFPFASGADGTQLIRSNDGRISQEFLYYALLEIDLTNYFYARHFKILKSKDLRLPPFDLIAEFTRLVSPMTERTAVLIQENVKLAEARDMLLPKLMSGAEIG